MAGWSQNGWSHFGSRRAKHTLLLLELLWDAFLEVKTNEIDGIQGLAGAKMVGWREAGGGGELLGGAFLEV